MARQKQHQVPVDDKLTEPAKAPAKPERPRVTLTSKKGPRDPAPPKAAVVAGDGE